MQCSFVLTCLLVACGIWASVVHSENQVAQQTEVSKLLEPTSAYFDKNRDTAGIVAIAEVASGTLCSTTSTKSEVSDLFIWPGALEGYRLNGVYNVGTTTAAGAETYGALQPITVDVWKNGKKFCVTRLDPAKTTFVDQAGNSCGGNNVACSECECYTSTTATTVDAVCPYSQFQIVSTITAPFKACVLGSTTLACKWGEHDKEQRSYLVDLSVELYDVPCKNPTENPTSEADWEVLLNENRAGCDQYFGKDDVNSLLADEQEVKDFFTANAAKFTELKLGTFLKSQYYASTKKAKLFGRYQIETSCSLTCRKFRMTAPTLQLMKYMEAAYEDIKTLAYVSGVGGAITIIWLLTVLLRKKHSTQTHYLVLYVWTLVLAFLMMILLAMFSNSISTGYNTTRAQFKTGANCITDAGWKTLPLKLYTDSEMNHTWANVFLSFLVIGLAGALCILHYVVSNIGKLKRPQNVQQYGQMY